MAQRSKLAVLLNGLPQNVDLSADELVLDSVRLGGGAGTQLTKTIIDGLIANSHAPMSDNQNITAGDGLSGGGSGASVTIDVDNTVVRTSGVNAFTANQSMGGFKLTNLGAPTANSTDAATTAYVDAAVSAAAPTAASVSYNNVTSGLAATNVQNAIDEVENRLDTVEQDKIDVTQKGAVNGVATLDANQLVPITQIPPAALERLVIVSDQVARFQLTTALAQNGDTVKQNDTGIMYFVKDDANLSNAGGYEEYTAGTASAVAWSGVTGTPTTLSGYGITDYAAAAKAAAVSDSITDGITDVAPSQNAVFDALALKQPASANLNEADTFFGSTDLSAAEAEQLSDGSNADSLHSHALVKKLMVAGEAFAANTSFLVRFALTGETAGRVYKATAASASADKKFWAIGIAHSTSAVSAGQSIQVILLGSHTLGSLDTNFNAADVGLSVWLTTAGGFSVTSPSSSGDASYKVGIVEDVDKILIDSKQLTGIN